MANMLKTNYYPLFSLIELSLRCLRHLLCSDAVLAVYHMKNHLTLPGIDISSHFVLQ